MKELLALEQELKEIQEEGNKRVVDYILKSQAAETIKEGGHK